MTSFRRIITSHSPNDTDGSQVIVQEDVVQLQPKVPGLEGAPLYATLRLPVTNPHVHNGDVHLPAGVVTPNGVNAQVTHLQPGTKVGMHRTDSLDYNIFVDGSGWLVTPGASGEVRTPIGVGSVVVQTGTLHAWEAESDGLEWCTVVDAAKPVQVGGSDLPEVAF